jgi:hypothetical protein
VLRPLLLPLLFPPTELCLFNSSFNWYSEFNRLGGIYVILDTFKLRKAGVQILARFDYYVQDLCDYIGIFVLSWKHRI